MPVLETRAYAKLNLSLDVLDRRSDGYHEMRMVMQTVTLSDALPPGDRHGKAPVHAQQPGLPARRRAQPGGGRRPAPVRGDGGGLRRAVH